MQTNRTLTMKNAARRQDETRFAPGVVPAVVAGFLAFAGCQSALPPDPGWPAFSRLSSETGAPPPVPPDETGTIDLTRAVAYALATSPRIRSREQDLYRAAGDLAEARTWRSPEVRMGFGRSDEDSRGWATQEETGWSRRAGGETSRAVREGSETFNSEKREWGWLTEKETRTQDTRSESGRSRSFNESSRFSSSTRSADFSGQTEDGFRLGLRFFPPNPWVLSAESRTLRAEQGQARAELLVEEHRLVCDIMETVVELDFREQALELLSNHVETCRARVGRAGKAAADGHLAREDYLDAGLALNDAEADRDREARRLDALRQQFLLLTGVDPSRVSRENLRPGSLCRLGPAEADRVRELARQRPDLLAAYWNLRRNEGEWREARARRYPWLSHIEVSYSWWDGEQDRTRTFDQRQGEDGRSSESSTEQESTTQTERRETTSNEVTTGSGTGTETETQSSEGYDWQSSASSGSQYSRDESEGNEWWFGAGIELPIFEWFSRETRHRQRARTGAEQDYAAALARAEREIRLALEPWLRAGAERAEAETRSEARRHEWEAAADRSESLGLAGQLDALKIRRRILDLKMQSEERRMHALMDELTVCRAAGLVPGQAPGEGEGPVLKTP